MNEQGTNTDLHTSRLMGPDMPADNGLASLGLIMQLGGSIFMGVMSLITVAFLLVASRVPGGTILTVVGILGVVRSIMHRTAGGALVYGSTARGPFRATLYYGLFAIVHSLLAYWVLGSKLHMPAAGRQSVLLMMLAWPVTLLVVIHLPRFKRFVDEIPTSEDRGYEGAGVLMVLFGSLGVVTTGVLALMLVVLGDGRILNSMEGLLVFGCLVALVVRSVMHLRAGLVAVQDRGQELVSSGAYRYVSWGVMTAIATGVALLLSMVMNDAEGKSLAIIGILVFMLMSWPLIVRRFFYERDFAVTLDPSVAQEEYRAPDLGMTALGWLLLAGAVLGLAMSLGPDDPAKLRGVGRLVSSMMPTDLAQSFGRSKWWTVGSSCLQLWAAIELIGMTKRWKLSVYIYGAVATAAALYLALPMIENLNHFMRLVARRGPGGLVIFGQLAIALIVPVGAMLLANRHKKPAALARIRQSTGDAATH